MLKIDLLLSVVGSASQVSKPLVGRGLPSSPNPDELQQRLKVLAYSPALCQWKIPSSTVLPRSEAIESKLTELLAVRAIQGFTVHLHPIDDRDYHPSSSDRDNSESYVELDRIGQRPSREPDCNRNLRRELRTLRAKKVSEQRHEGSKERV